MSSNNIIGETVKLYQKGEGPLKNRCFNEFYTNYRVNQHSDDEKKAEATRLLAMGMTSNFSDEKSQKLYDHYTKNSPQKLEIEMSKLYDIPLESCRPKGCENDQKASNRRVFIKGRVKNLCKVFQEKMDMLEKTLPESKKNALINQIHGTVIRIQKKVDCEDTTPKSIVKSTKIANSSVNSDYKSPKSTSNKSVASQSSNSVTPKADTTFKPAVNTNATNTNKYGIKKTSIVNNGDFLFTNSVTPKSVNKMVKNFNDKTTKNTGYNHVISSEFTTPKSSHIHGLKYCKDNITDIGNKIVNEHNGIKQSVPTPKKTMMTINGPEIVFSGSVTNNKITNITNDNIETSNNNKVLDITPVLEPENTTNEVKLESTVPMQAKKEVNEKLGNASLGNLTSNNVEQMKSTKFSSQQEIHALPEESIPDPTIGPSENVVNNDISSVIDNIMNDQTNCLVSTPGYNSRYDISPISDGNIFEDLLRELDEMIINQVDEEAEFNLSDDEDQFSNNTSINHQFAWFFKAVSNHVLSKPDNDDIDEGTKEQLDWFLA